MTKITHPPADVTQRRYALYRRFIADDDMPADIRQAAVFYFDQYRKQRDVGEAMAGELVWQLIVFAAADPMQRMNMVLHGYAFQAQKMWEEIDRKEKLARQV